MGIFSKKAKLEDVCRDFYDKAYINPKVGAVDASKVFYEVSRKNLIEVDKHFEKITLENITKELQALQFEMFALAWTHKFISGKFLVAQSAFTKRYLHEKGKDDIWENMKDYNDIIDGTTLEWLINQSRMTLGFNYGVREDLTKENTKEAEELNITDKESIQRANHRLWSGEAWRQKKLHISLVYIFCKHLNLKVEELNRDAIIGLGAIIHGMYEGAKESWRNIKIVL